MSLKVAAAVYDCSNVAGALGTLIDDAIAAKRDLPNGFDAKLWNNLA